MICKSDKSYNIYRYTSNFLRIVKEFQYKHFFFMNNHLGTVIMKIRRFNSIKWKLVVVFINLLCDMCR
jgi:hypothetical protein